jgi:hypothetical protein
MGHPDFDLISESGYTATMDLPFALYYDQIKDQYPECKFILTVRENSEIWFRSWNVLANSIIQPAMFTSEWVGYVKKLENYMRSALLVSFPCVKCPPSVFRILIQPISNAICYSAHDKSKFPMTTQTDKYRWLFSVVNSDKIFLSHPFPLPPQNKRNAIRSYESHNQSVRDIIPASRLLEYDVREGWEPLCRFLEVPDADCPSARGIPFPKSNSARAIKWQSYSAFIIFFSAIVFVLFALALLVFRKVTGSSVCGWLASRRERAKCVPMAKKD